MQREDSTGAEGSVAGDIGGQRSAQDRHLFYCSFMTLKVGYGDIAPLSGWAQVLAVVEALAGQILLVVIGARLVGLHIRQSPEAADPTDAGARV